MSHSYIYNIDEFVTANNIQNHYGAAIACMKVNRNLFEHMKSPGTTPSFYSIILIIDGWQKYVANNNKLKLDMHDLLVTMPFIDCSFDTCSKEVLSFHLLIEKNYFDDLISHNETFRDTTPMDIFSTIPVFHLSEVKAASFFQMMENINKTIMTPHLYKNEMIQYQLNICLLMLAELVSGHEVNTHDLKHKDNILKIFLHLASRNFKKERQVQFYADHLNISPTYLSRTIKELTGNTVFGYLSNFLYSEICIQLKTTEKTISEIADDLNFNDQSALTNFFRSKSGISPLAYRKKKEPTP